MAKTIRWGILGTGTVAHAAAQAFELVEQAELLAIGSREQERAQAFSEKFDGLRAYGSYDRLLSDPEIDVVYVATPNHRHSQDSLKCLEAGKAVLCEKPFALNAAEAERVVDLARQRGLFCMEAMWMRFIPALIEARDRIARGEIGDIRILKADLGYPTPYDPDNRYYNRALGGGCLLDRGVYLVSLAHLLMGVPRVIRSCGVIGDTGVDYQSAYLLEYDDGGIADLTTSLQTRGTNEAVILGTSGRIRIHDPFFRSWRITVDRFSPPVAPEQTGSDRRGSRDRLATLLRRYPEMRRLHQRVDTLVKRAFRGKSRTITYAGNGYQFELAEVTRCLGEGLLESSLMPPAETLAVMRTMDAIRRPWTLRYDQDPTEF